MTHLIPATLVRDAMQRVALSALPNAPVLEDRRSPKATRRLLGARLTLWRNVHDLSHRRQQRANHLALRRDLATFTTQAEVDDLLQTIEGQQGAEADVIRGILIDNLHRHGHQLAS
jgi:hypothetical protein